MKFKELKLKGVFLIELQKFDDERGFFARTWDKKIFEEHGLNSSIVQCATSFNKKKGTIRGIHYQASPYEEAKVVSCTKGRIFDVLVDLRKRSQTYKNWIGIELGSQEMKILYVPEGIGHGYQTLKNNADVSYLISQYYTPEYSRGVRWDDPAFNIKWPLKPTVISKRDKSFPSFGG